MIVDLLRNDLARILGARDIRVVPYGSVTGAPKYCSMEIIGELECTSRGLYCGAIGMIAPTGDGGIDATFSVAIRTLVHDRATGHTQWIEESL